MIGLRIAVLALALAGPLAQGLHGQELPGDGACPGDSEYRWTRLLAWEHKRVGDFMTTYELIVQPAHLADIPTGHEIAAQVERWALNHEGEYVIAQLYHRGPVQDMTCLHKGFEWRFEVEHEDPNYKPRPCWKFFSGHAILGTKRKPRRTPSNGKKTHGCWGA